MYQAIGLPASLHNETDVRTSEIRNQKPEIKIKKDAQK